MASCVIDIPGGSCAPNDGPDGISIANSITKTLDNDCANSFGFDISIRRGVKRVTQPGRGVSLAQTSNILHMLRVEVNIAGCNDSSIRLAVMERPHGQV